MRLSEILLGVFIGVLAFCALQALEAHLKVHFCEEKFKVERCDLLAVPYYEPVEKRK